MKGRDNMKATISVALTLALAVVVVNALGEAASGDAKTEAPAASQNGTNEDEAANVPDPQKRFLLSYLVGREISRREETKRTQQAAVLDIIRDKSKPACGSSTGSDGPVGAGAIVINACGNVMVAGGSSGGSGGGSIQAAAS